MSVPGATTVEISKFGVLKLLGDLKKTKDKPEEELYVEEEEEGLNLQIWMRSNFALEYPEKEEVSTSYRWPQLFIEALQALNGKGTRSEIVHWLESHYAEYLESRPTWRGNLTNLNKQGFLNKYWTREEIGVSENGRTKYLYKLIQGKFNCEFSKFINRPFATTTSQTSKKKIGSHRLFIRRSRRAAFCYGIQTDYDESYWKEHHLDWNCTRSASFFR